MKTPHIGTFWVGEVLDEPIVAALESWVRHGATLPVPAEVAEHLFDRRSMTAEPDAEPIVEFVSLERSAQR